MKKINILLLSVNEEKKIKNFPTDKWEFRKSNEEVVVSTETHQKGSKSKIKLSISKRDEYSYMQLLGLNINIADLIDTLSPASIEKCLSSLIRQINEKLYEEYDFQIIKNGENVNSVIDDLKFAKNFILSVQENLFN